MEIFAIAIVAIGAIIYQEVMFRKERRELLNRIMTTDYREFNYYQKAYPAQVKEDTKELERVRKTEEKEGTRKTQKMEDNEEVDLSGFDEDWEGDDIDVPELQRRLGKDIVDG